MTAPRESLYPAHASWPAVKLPIPGPTAWGTFEEMWAQTLAKLREQAEHDGHPDACAVCRGEAVAR